MEISNLVVVSDTHSGCGLALCPEGILSDDGAIIPTSLLQKKIKAMWDEFWGEFVPDATKHEPFAVVHNGDALDGVHHNSTTQITHNLTIQRRIAYALLKPIYDSCEGRYYHIRGTEAHVGQSAQEEEALAEQLGAIKNQEGQFSRYELWKAIDGKIIHLLHHVGSTGSQAYEATAVHKELTESFIEAARWGRRPPDMIVRSHRHRCIEINIPTGAGHSTAVVTPCWQGKTPYSWRIAGARLSTPQFGGIVIRVAHGEMFIRRKVWTIEPSPVE